MSGKKPDIDELEGLLAGSTLQRPTAAVRRRALALGSRLSDRTARPWWAALTFDSALAAPCAGVRSAVSETRRLVYDLDAGDGDRHLVVDLALTPCADASLELRGQLMPMLEGLRLEVRDGAKVRAARLESTGEFSARLPRRSGRGGFSIVLLSDDDELVELGPLWTEGQGGNPA